MARWNAHDIHFLLVILNHGHFIGDMIYTKSIYKRFKPIRNL